MYPMFRFVYSPQWFFGIDAVFEFLMLSVMILVAAYSYFYCYKHSGEESHKYFSIGFFLMGISFFFKILTNITIVYDAIKEAAVGPYLFTVTTVQHWYLFYVIGTSLFYALFLIGLLAIWLVTYRQYHKPTIALLTFLILLVALFSHATYVVFYLCTAVFFGCLFWKYWQRFIEKKTKKGLALAGSFLIILASQAVFMFVWRNLQLYVLAESLQLLGFILLLIAFISVVRK